MPVNYSGDGHYICRVDTGIGEQYAVIQVTKPPNVTGAWNPLDGLSNHYKYLAGGPGATPEAAWAQWRATMPAGNFGTV